MLQCSIAIWTFFFGFVFLPSRDIKGCWVLTEELFQGRSHLLNQGIEPSHEFTMAIAETPGKMYALAAVLSILAVIAAVLRFYARRLLKTARIEMDDYMILPALVYKRTLSIDQNLTLKLR